MARNGPITIQTELSRDMGLTTAMAIGVGTMIAAGIFTLSGLAVRNVGSGAILSFLIAAVVAAFTALTYCELVSVYPESGEGYLYTRKTFPGPLAYLVGSALILGYTSSCAFYLASFSSYFVEFIYHTPVENIAGVFAVAGLTLINIKGTKESGTFQIVVTVAKVVLLIWFVSGGLGSVDMADLMERFVGDAVKIGGTAAMVFITFFGFSAIAASAGEVKDPTRTIPRAIFISMGVVVLLYTFVVAVVSSAGLTEYNEAAMGEAAVRFLGPIGGMVIIGGALFSMISASNASILAGSRVTLAMSRMGHLPGELGIVNPRTRTPIVSLVMVAIMIVLFMVGLDLEGLAHFADTVLILALVLVNFTLIAHRRKFPNIERPFRVPFVPLLPVLGILANLFLLSQIVSQHPLPMFYAVGAMLAGAMAFISWKGTRPPEVALPGAPSRVALAPETAGKAGYRVLVPVANPDNVPKLMEIASALARAHDGEVVVLRVVQVPDQVSPSPDAALAERERGLLELAQTSALIHNVTAYPVIRVGHNVARSILETAGERDCDTILLGWKGYTTTARKILGDVVDDIVRNAKCDILLTKHVANETFRNILLPTAGGVHARRAESYAAALAGHYDGSVTVCSVVAPDADADTRRQVTGRLNKAVNRLLKVEDLEVHRKTVRHSSVNVGLIKEAENYDALMLGAAGDSAYPRRLFGSIPELIAKHCDRPVIIVKRYQPVKELLGRVMEE